MKTSYSTTTSNNSNPTLENLLQLYRATTGRPADSHRAITGSASSRQYYHIYGPTPLVGAIGNNVTENRAFLHIDSVLHEHGVNVPRVVAVSDDNICYLQDDLGDMSLFDVIKRDGFTDSTIRLCRRAIDNLVALQVAGASAVDPTICFPVPAMSGDSIMWDLNYFKYCFLKISGIEIDEPRLELDFKKLATQIEQAAPQLFIHRDFQSRNILIHDNDTWIIDFQGGRRGPALYDIVSFLWQARAGVPDDVKARLLDYYIDVLCRHVSVSPERLTAATPHIIIFRTLQVLGAYGFRGIIEQKQRFVTYIPQALSCLADTLRQLDGSYPYIRSVIDAVTPRFNHLAPPTPPLEKPTLSVSVYSFSYKKGIPTDESGNGGGFVFDCRAVHNPGRYEQYRSLTGEDQPVIDFLERDGEITTFLSHCKSLVDTSVERYIKRGFTHLSVSFGCTGGRHRSVYSARHMADHLAQKYGIHVNLMHREQGITREYNPS